MVSKSSFTSKLMGDPRQRAEIYASEGKKQKAAEMYARAGDFRQAARLAIEAGDERLAVDSSLKAAFGASSADMQAARPLLPLEAAELLASRGHHHEAIGLFELGHSYRRAAASALQLGQAARAGRLFERGRALFEAAEQFEAAELLEDALRVLELELKRLGRGDGREARGDRGERRDARDARDGAARLDGPAQEQLAKVERRRIEVLRKLGRGGDVAAALRETRPTAQTVRLLEENGKFREAIEAALQIGDMDAAVRLLRRAPDFDRRLAAQIYLRGGHAIEAANQFASLGLAREAAEAYEAGGDWAKAGSRWETAQEHERAAEAYMRGRRPGDAARCYSVLGKPALAGAAYAKAGDHAAAAAQYLKARQPLAAANSLLGAARPGEAAKVLMQVPSGSPEHETATLQLVPLLLAEGRADDALRRLRLLPPARPAGIGERSQTVRERIYWLGRAYEQSGKLDQAESCYRELADPAAEHRDALSRLGAVQERQRLAQQANLSSTLLPGLSMPGGTATWGFNTPAAALASAIPPTPPTPPIGATSVANLGTATAAYATPRPGPVSGPAAPASRDSAADAAWLDAIPHPPPPTAPTPTAGGGRRPSASDLATRSTGAFARAAEGAAAPGAAATPEREAPKPASQPSAGAANRGPGRPIQPLDVGQVLAGRFEILAEIGQGGMGRVYKAHDLDLGDMVAIKMLLGQPDDGSVDAERLLREVQICRKITHPNVVRVFDLGRHDGWIFIIMELLEGQGLVELIESPTRPPTSQIKTILGEIAAGLQEAHLLGVVHRDLKPENVILTANRVKLLDFGIARMTGLDKRLTQVGFAVGSPMYMSPEQIQGIPMDGRSDLYSLGVLAFALLTGGEPFDGPNPTAIAIQHLQQAPADLRVLRPDLPAGWSELIATLLAKKPEDRYQSCQAFLDALTPLAVA